MTDVGRKSGLSAHPFLSHNFISPTQEGAANSKMHQMRSLGNHDTGTSSTVDGIPRMSSRCVGRRASCFLALAFSAPPLSPGTREDALASSSRFFF